MKALVLEAYNKLVYKEVDRPVPGSQEVLVEVKAAGICGSDVHGLDRSTGRRIPPVIMGHEASGIIAETGGDVIGWQVGERVTFDSTIYRLDDWYTRSGHYNLSEGRMVLGVSCGEYRRNGAFAQYVAVPQHILYRIPDNVSFEQAAMVEPLAVALHSINLSGARINDHAVVFGSGMIGLSLVQLLKIAGCHVTAVDVADEKLAMARDAGADECLDAGRDDVAIRIREMTSGRGADLGFEAVGIAGTLKAAVDSLRKGATLVLLGNLAPLVDLPLQKVVTREITLKGSCAINGEYPAILELLAAGHVRVDRMMSVVVPLSDGARFFDRLYHREPGLLKVILKP